MRSALAVLCLAASLGAAAAQDPKPNCAPAAPSAPATPPAAGANSGTAPGGMGSTAWSGGTGGSHIGATGTGPTAASPNEHPETAKGLDPTKKQAGAQPPARC